MSEENHDIPRYSFSSREQYESVLGDPSFWRPYVEAALRRHGLTCGDVRLGRVGSFPAFLVDDTRVVKLYGDIFEGENDFTKEVECHRLADNVEAIPAPRLIGSGRLFNDQNAWRWPYIIMTRIPGRPVAEVWDEMSPEDRLRLAQWLGKVVRALHQLPLAEGSVLRPEWGPFAEKLQQVYRDAVAEAAQPDNPAWLVEQIDEYLGGPEAWYDSSEPPVLVHADLHEDHVFVRQREGQWEPVGLIDFGDSLAGDWIYELPALHFGTFDAEKRLLRAFLDSYSPDEGRLRDLPRRALRFTILHEFVGLKNQFRNYPYLRDLPNLVEVEKALWDVFEE